MAEETKSKPPPIRQIKPSHLNQGTEAFRPDLEKEREKQDTLIDDGKKDRKQC